MRSTHRRVTVRRKGGQMRTFDEIFAIAADRKGGPDALDATLRSTVPDPNLRDLPEDRWLSAMTRAVFQAGFSWKVIDAKWDGFEAAFKGFDVDACAMMDDRWFDELVSDTRIVRNGAKIQSVRDNAVFVSDLRDEGGVGAVVEGWPDSDFAGLLDMLKRRGSRLGGTSGQYMLRSLGKDSYILSQDVTARLIAEGVIDKPATSKTAMSKVQGAFNTWAEQSGRPLCQISRVLAQSIA